MTRPRLLKLLVRLSLIGYTGLLGLIIMAALDLFNTSWPFELFASYMRHALLLLPIAVAFAIWAWRITLLPILVVALIAFWPFLSFSKYAAPTGEPCTPQQTCLTVVSANLQGNLTAMDRTAVLAREEAADIVTLLEIPQKTDMAQLRRAYQDFPYLQILSGRQDGRPRYMRLAIFSRYPLGPKSKPASDNVTHINGPRFISTFLHMPETEPVQIIAVHPYPPMTPSMAWGRDQTLSEAVAVKDPGENFIMLGDFNTTPWTPAFSKLPGKRAGDPRLISTWDAHRFWMGIPIDHILIGDDFEVLSTAVLPATLSDHRPITARLALK